MAKKIIAIGTLIMVILTYSIYVKLPDQVKIDVQPTKTILSVWENGAWEIGATEYLYLYDGTKKMRASSREVYNYTLPDGRFETIRKAYWKDNITTWHVYLFDPTISDVELVPVDSYLQCDNCEGKIVHFEYRVEYNGVTREAHSPERFPHRTHVEWEDDYDWAKVYQNKVARDKLVIRYRPDSNFVEYHVRLFDPSSLNLSLDNFTYDIDVELGSVINVTATTNTSGETVCVDVDHPSYGTNYSCGTNSTSFNLNITWFQETMDNESRTTFNLTYNQSGAQNKTFYIRSHQYAEAINLSINLSGIKSDGSFPSGVTIYVNATQTNFLGQITNITDAEIIGFNDSSTAKNTTFELQVTNIAGYVKVPKNSTVTGTKMTLQGFKYLHYVQSDDYITNPKFETEDSGWSFYTTDASITGTYITAPSYEGSKFYRTTYVGTSGQNNYGGPNQSLDITYVDYMRAITYKQDQNPYSNTWVGRLMFGASTIYTFGTGSVETIAVDVSAYTGTQNVRYAAYCTSGAGCFGRSTVFDVDNVSLGVNRFPEDVWMEVGVVNGTRTFETTGIYNTSNSSDDFSGDINSYLVGCTADGDGFCHVPIYVFSSTIGQVQISDIQINYTVNVNPVVISISSIQTFLAGSTNFADIPIIIKSDTNGTLTVDDIQFDYAGGNDTIEVKAHTTNYSVNKTYNITFYYSDWNYSLPGIVQYLEFIPKTSDAKNVTPYRQKDSTPILNITTHNYGGKNLNFSIYLNESDSCVNMSINTNSTKPSSILQNNTWTDLITDQGYLSNFGNWMWSDYNCNETAWRLWYPTLSFRACCVGCEICSEEVI